MNSLSALRARDRGTAIAGFAFIGLLVVAFVIGSAPEADASDATILDYYTDGGNQAKQVVAAMLVTFALIAFLIVEKWLFAGISPRAAGTRGCYPARLLPGRPQNGRNAASRQARRR